MTSVSPEWRAMQLRTNAEYITQACKGQRDKVIAWGANANEFPRTRCNGVREIIHTYATNVWHLGR